MQTITASFAVGSDKMEVTVKYDRKEPENYEIVAATHNGYNVTDFYRMADENGEGLFYPQIVEAIAHDICSERINSGIWSTTVAGTHQQLTEKAA